MVNFLVCEKIECDERSYTNYLNINPGKSAAGYLRSLQKLERVA
jgi:hypothetical protein